MAAVAIRYLPRSELRTDKVILREGDLLGETLALASARPLQFALGELLARLVMVSAPIVLVYLVR